MDNNSARILVETAVAGVTFGSLIEAIPSIVAIFAGIYYVAMTIEVVGRMKGKWKNKS